MRNPFRQCSAHWYIVREVFSIAGLEKPACLPGGYGMTESVGALLVQDYSEVLSRALESAQRNDREAQFRLGILSGLGLGCPQDYAEAVKWYTRAAEAGHAAAQSNLGFMYGTGRGVPQDYVRAYAWYSLAAAVGDEIARGNRDAVREMMAGDQLERAQRLAGELFDKLQVREN